MFAKYKKGDAEITPLPFLMKLLLNEKIQSGAIWNIDGTLENLLTMHEDEEEEERDEGEKDVEMKEERKPLNAFFVLDVQEEAISQLNRKFLNSFESV